MLKYLYILISGLFIIISLSAQQPASKSKKAIDFYNRGLQQYTTNDYAGAAKYLQEAIKEDSVFIHAWLVLAEVYEDWKQPIFAMNAYRGALKINPAFYPYALVKLANLEFSEGLYKEAKMHYEQFLNTPGEKNQKHIEKSKDGIARCDFSIYAMAHPVDFKPVSLGPNINTAEDEYWPSISADEQTLVITRLSKNEVNSNKKHEDFYVSHWEENGWGPIQNAGFPLNSPDNEGAQSISADGRIMVFTGCNRPDGKGRCDLYISVKEGDYWTMPKNMDYPVNSHYTETQPSLSADGKTLYFASDRPGGQGQVDIWQTRQLDNNQWSAPVNLGDVINSKGNEMSPFIHPDGQTLYLASDGHIGLGGFDLFISRKDSTGKWTQPGNLGYPINTHKDEYGLIVNPSGTRAYFASDIQAENGRDIYYFNLPEQARPNLVSYMKGIVFDAKTNKRLKANFELIDLKTREVTNKSKSDSITGEFLICIPANRNYLLNVSKKGYLFYSENFSFAGIYLSDKPFLKDIPLNPIEIGKTTVLRNIFYETDSYALKEESMVELDKLVRFLKENPAIRIEISGHTDNIGSAEYNMKLSENRSRTVAEYLIKASIDKERITYKGYGFSNPVAVNETEEGRAQNRRTEIKITDN
jgi:outer membrane protein OmpA-like peptidoglycan-associated protein/Tol biopolymer transport system component